jgi:tetratricopeptide (TPR) repeat protein
MFVGVCAAFFFYLVVWAVNVPDPVGNVQEFFMSPAERQKDVPFPAPPDLAILRGAVNAPDQPAFDRALGLIGTDPRRSGAAFWPLLARYPILRPSLAYRFLGKADEAFRKGLLWRSREFCLMALAADPHEFRAHKLLYLTCGRLGRKIEMTRHMKQTVSTRGNWSPPAPGADWAVVGAFLMGFAVIFSALHAYRTRIGLDGLLRGSLGLPPAPDLGGGVEMPTGIDGPTTIQNLDELRAARKEKKKSITAILSAEAFLKEIQDKFDQKEYESGVDLCLFEVGDYQNAKELLEVSLHFEPHVLEAHTCLGNCFIKLGDFDAARQQYEKVIEVDPKNGAAYYTLGVCYQKVGDLPRAMRSFEVGVKLDDSHANCHFYLAKLHEAAKDYASAIQHWTRFVELKPDSPHAAAAQDRLAKLASLAGAQPGA